MHRERHAHIAGRFDAKNRRAARYIARVVRKEKCTSFDTTESYDAALLTLVRLRLPEFSVVREGEYLLGAKRTTYATTRFSSLRRASFRYDDRETWRDLFVGRRRVVHRKSKRPVLLAGMHPPSGVQHGDTFTRSTKSVAWSVGMRRAGQGFASAMRRVPGLVVCVGIDTNTDHRSPVWRERNEVALGMESGWSQHPPKMGTHRPGPNGQGRGIDALYSNVPVLWCHVVRDVKRPKRYDHLAVVGTLMIEDAS